MRASELLIAGWLPIVDSVVKATLLFAAGALICWILRRASAASRHLVWTLAIAGALLLPVLSIALPRWQLPLMTVESTEIAPAAARASSSETYGKRVSDAELPPPPRLRAEASRESGKLGATYVPAVSWPAALFFAWTLGMGAILLRVLLGIAAVQWIARRSAGVTDAPWLPLAQQLADHLGISTRVRFLRSHRATMPMAVGIFRPAVLMPADADDWPAERLRIVLLHELAHVKRRDCLTQVVAQIACAFYWFNPLAWIAARHVRTERERACDDLVLAAGTHGPDYADQLLEIARVMRAGRFPAVLATASLAMARRSQLEGRLMAILDPSVPRSGVSRVRTSLAATAAAIALLPLASLQPWAHASEDTFVTPPQTIVARSIPPSREASAFADASADRRSPPGGGGSSAPEPHPTPGPGYGDRSAPDARPRATNVSAASAVPAGQIADGVRDPAALAEVVAEAVRDGVGDGVARAIAGAVADSIRGVDPGVLALEVPVIVERAVGEAMQDVTPKVAAESRTTRKTDPRTIAALTEALKDTDKDVRETALHALVQLRDPSIFEPLIQALRDASADVRAQAAAGLGQLRDRRALEPLVAAMNDQSGDVREQVAFALGQLRDRVAIPALVAALKDSDPDVREQVVFALGQLRDPATLEGLAAALRDARADVREQAAFALGQLRDRRAIEPLISALKDASPDVREQAAFALGQIRDKAAVEALIFALKDADAEVREQAAFALGQLGDPRAIDALTTALKDASASVRQQAAFALGQLIR